MDDHESRTGLGDELEDEQKLRAKLGAELKHVLDSGIWDMTAERIEFLSQVCGARRPDRLAVRTCLVRHLAKRDPDTDLSDHEHIDLNALDRRTCFNLILFRYPTECLRLTKLNGEGGVYQQAGNYWGDDGVGEDRVRQKGGPKDQAVKELVDDLLDEWHARRERLLVPVRSLDDIRDHYRANAPHEPKLGFWWRSGTQPTLDIICKELKTGPVTLYAGCDGSSDVGLPLQDPLLAETLEQWLPNDPLFRLVRETKEKKRSDVAADVVNWMTKYCGSRFTGSVLSELVRALPIRRSNVRPGDNDARLRAPMLTSVDQERPTTGLVARSVCLLAEAIKSAQVDVQILSSFVDGDLETEPDGCQPGAYRYEVRDQFDTAPPEDDVIPITYMAGQVDDDKVAAGALVLGEADYITAEPSLKDFRGLEWSMRMRLLETALVETVVVFVGSSLTDPGVVAALAATKHFKVPRYAIVMAPNEAELVDHEHRGLIRLLLAERYLHLGVVPLIVDFPAQAVQVLQELAYGLRDDPHPGYVERLDEWWRVVGPALGRLDNAAGVDRASYREALGGVVASFKKAVERLFKELTPGPGGDDELTVILWIREPDQTQRTLFPASWAGIDDVPNEMALTAYADARRGVSRDDLLPVYAFREGAILRTEADDAESMTVALPVILEGDWKHLPVGVVTVASTQREGRLSQLAQDSIGLDSLADAMKVLSGALGRPDTLDG